MLLRDAGEGGPARQREDSSTEWKWRGRITPCPDKKGIVMILFIEVAWGIGMRLLGKICFDYLSIMWRPKTLQWHWSPWLARKIYSMPDSSSLIYAIMRFPTRSVFHNRPVSFFWHHLRQKPVGTLCKTSIGLYVADDVLFTEMSISSAG